MKSKEQLEGEAALERLRRALAGLPPQDDRKREPEMPEFMRDLFSGFGFGAHK